MDGSALQGDDAAGRILAGEGDADGAIGIDKGGSGVADFEAVLADGDGSPPEEGTEKKASEWIHGKEKGCALPFRRARSRCHGSFGYFP